MSPPTRRWPPPGSMRETTTRPVHNINKCETDRRPWSPEAGHIAPRPVHWTDGLEAGCLLSPEASSPVRGGDPDTSAAAAAHAPEYRSELRARVLAAHRAAAPDGLTDDQVAELLPDAHPPSLTKRRLELVRAGLLVDSGRRRKTRRGSDAVVWVLTGDITD